MQILHLYATTMNLKWSNRRKCGLLVCTTSVCPTQWGLSVWDCQCSRVVYWWCDCWGKLQDEFWSVRSVTFCSVSVTCCRADRTALQSTGGRWREADHESDESQEGKEMDWSKMAVSGNHIERALPLPRTNRQHLKVATVKGENVCSRPPVVINYEGFAFRCTDFYNCLFAQSPLSSI